MIALDDGSALAHTPNLPAASSSSSAPPPTHIGPVSSEATSSYDPAVLARTTLNAQHATDQPSSTPARGRSSSDARSDSDDDPWDDWGNDGPTSSAAGLTGAGNGIRRTSDDEEDEAGEREMKDLDVAGGEGGRTLDQKLRKELYWRHVAVTGIFVALWLVDRRSQ